MKTAISVPDATFKRIESRAKALGMSRSEFFARAAEHYINELDEHDLTLRINEALERGGDTVEAESREFAELGRAHLAGLTADDEW
ncbi:ribbon-helix-helix protein, CopG family [Antribacter gilvus]|uniref:ribbon-helix-helix protein, CopG family n=1 Tax=Antribacter gilvus TaxID=2304675 RepID=UPI000F78EFD4|nr:ribbon-helix-helix protein, CopG family [Antribacter gilvus]